MDNEIREIQISPSRPFPSDISPESTPLHNDGAVDLVWSDDPPAACSSLSSIVNFKNRVQSNFGQQFTYLLATNYFCLKGALYMICVSVQLPFYKSLKFSGLKYQTYHTVAMIPWSMKGFIGALSDSLPIFGYSKRYYMLFASIFGFGGMATLAFSPLSVFVALPPFAAIMFFLVNVEIATLDLLCEGKYAEFMGQKPESRADVVTFVWTFCTLGQFVASCFVGPVTDYLGSRLVIICGLPLTASLIIPLIKGYLPEAKITNFTGVGTRTPKDKRRQKLLAFACLVAVVALLFAFIGLVCSIKVQFAFATSSGVVVAIAAFFALDRTLALCTLYLFVQDCLYLNLSGALEFWYTADSNCVPNGPAFSYTYYQTYTLLVGQIATAVALAIFQTFLSTRKIREVFWLTTVLRALASVFDVIIVQRWNISVGISDKVMYLFGDAIVLPICTMLNFLPAVILTAKLCPKAMESTVYAILAGFGNFGVSVARAAGGYAMDRFQISTEAPNCNFDNLPKLIILAHFILPLLSIPLTFILIPDKKLCDEFLDIPEVSESKNVEEEMRLCNTSTEKNIADNSPHTAIFGKPMNEIVGDGGIELHAREQVMHAFSADTNISRNTMEFDCDNT